MVAVGEVRHRDTDRDPGSCDRDRRGDREAQERASARCAVHMRLPVAATIPAATWRPRKPGIASRHGLLRLPGKTTPQTQADGLAHGRPTIAGLLLRISRTRPWSAAVVGQVLTVDLGG